MHINMLYNYSLSPSLSLYVYIHIGCKISNLSFDCLVDEVRDWGCGVGWQGGTDQRDDEVIDQDVDDAGVSLAGQMLVRRIGGIDR
jgi:hypothetical protein